MTTLTLSKRRTASRINSLNWSLVAIPLELLWTVLLFLLAFVIGHAMPRYEAETRESGYDRMTQKEHDEAGAFWGYCEGYEL